MKGKIIYGCSLFILLLSFLLPCSTCSAQPGLYATLFVSPGNRMMCQVDPVTGAIIQYPASTSPGFMNNSFIPAIDAAGNRFIIPMSQQLFSFDMATGNVLSSPSLPGPFSFVLPAYNCFDSTLYGLSETATGYSFVSIDPVTGTINNIAPNVCQFYSSNASCAIDMQGRRYFFVGQDQNNVLRLYTLDLSTGAVLSNPALSTPFDYITYSCRDNTIYGITYQNGLWLSRINNMTGQITVISTTPVTGSALASSSALDPIAGIFYMLVPDLFNPVTHLYSWNVTTGNVLNSPSVNPMVAFLGFKTPCSPNAAFTVTSNCSGIPVSFTADPSAQNNYWGFGDPSSAGNNFSTAQNPSHVFSSPGTYNVMHIVYACSGNDTSVQQVTVMPPSFPPLNLGNDTALCSSALLLNDNYPGSYNFLWQDSSTLSTYTATSTGTYWVQVSDSNCTDHDTISLTFTGVSASLTGPATICAGDSAILSATGGTSYSWSTGATSASVVVSPGNDSIYSVIVSSAQGCSDTVSLLINVVPTPAITAAPSSAVICQGDTITISATASNNYQWSTGDTTSAITISPGISSSYYAISSNGPCADTAFTSITVNPQPYAQIDEPLPICQGTSLVLTSTTSGAVLWSTGDTASSIIVTPASSQTYYLNATNSCGAASDSVNVIVHPVPAVFTSGDTTIFPGEQVQLDASGGISYSWDPSSSLSCNDCSSPMASPGETTTYTVTVTNTNGCVTFDTLTVYVESEAVLFIPTAFSPNGDGNNDVLYVRGKGIQSVKLIVFDRVGEEVFFTTHISNGWDGTFRGKEMNSGVFVYYLEATMRDGRTIVKEGDITLVR